MVNIDTIYQRVLALANKEQRGYITPQEFNLFANQAQMDIFEQYFYDIGQRERIPGSKDSYADISTLLEEKIDIFLKSFAILGTGVSANIVSLPDDYYKISEVRSEFIHPKLGAMRQEVERMTYKEFNLVRLSPLTAPTHRRPIYYQKDNRVIIGDGDHAPMEHTINIGYIRKPLQANWTYIVVGEKALSNPDPAIGYMDFDLHPSEETKLVIKILGLAGVTLKDPTLYQIAAAEENKSIQQQK